jgi:hypothetical protein
MDERLTRWILRSPWVVCFTHAKRLHHGVWERMHDTPPDVMQVASKPCDQCLSVRKRP